jgi:hypothetical protein
MDNGIENQEDSTVQLNAWEAGISHPPSGHPDMERQR